MSKHIDWVNGTEPLTDEERHWANNNNLSDEVHAYDARLAGHEPFTEEPEVFEHTGDVDNLSLDGPSPTGAQNLDTDMGRLRGVGTEGDLSSLIPQQRESPKLEEVDKPYEEWTSSELIAELKARGLSTSGSKAEMSARLQKWDEQHPAES